MICSLIVVVRLLMMILGDTGKESIVSKKVFSYPKSLLPLRCHESLLLFPGLGFESSPNFGFSSFLFILFFHESEIVFRSEFVFHHRCFQPCIGVRWQFHDMDQINSRG